MKKFEFTDRGNAWVLTLNGAVNKIYPKMKYSKSAAEGYAWEVVHKAMIKYGYERVEYDGCFQTN